MESRSVFGNYMAVGSDLSSFLINLCLFGNYMVMGSHLSSIFGNFLSILVTIWSCVTFKFNFGNFNYFCGNYMVVGSHLSSTLVTFITFVETI